MHVTNYMGSIWEICVRIFIRFSLSFIKHVRFSSYNEYFLSFQKMKISFKNLLKREPALRFIVLTDQRTCKLCIVYRLWLKYGRGLFYYPAESRNLDDAKLKALIKGDVDPMLEPVGTFELHLIKTIFNESGNNNLVILISL